MTAQQIIALPNATKTAKIKMLFELGLSRREVATLMGIGYGFVQNVFASTYPDQVQSRGNRRTRRASGQHTPTTFDRKFGIEIEAFFRNGYTQQELCNKLADVGIECQIEGYNHTSRRHWKIVSDSSIRGRGVAFELVSPVLKGAEGLEQVKKVCGVLNQMEAQVNKSCGLHVHIDASRFELAQWKNLIFNYHKLESVIDGFMPKSRRENNNEFCLSINRHNLAGIEAATDIQGLTGLATTRYNKINLLAYTRHKTVEFRHHSGTVEWRKISNWLVFLDSLVTFSLNNRLGDNNNLSTLGQFCPAETVAFYKQRTLTLTP